MVTVSNSKADCYNESPVNERHLTEMQAQRVSLEHMSVKRKKRGFALMSKAQLYAVTSAGGKAVHAVGTAHTWTRDEAIKAGSKGGKKLKGSKWSRM